MPFRRFLLPLLAGFSTTLSAIETDQILNLDAGWNAVWLEVDPVDADGVGKAPPTVFSNPAIETVATPNNTSGSIEFVENASGGFFNASDWQVWHRTTELGSNTLGAVRGYRGYLIKTSSATNLSITGTVRFQPIQWEPNSYNLVGFGLTGTVNFGQFFSSTSTTHPVNRIFKLDSATGNWVAVTSTESMVSNQAYWVYSDGKSEFNGVVQVSYPGSDTMDFDDDPETISFPDPNNNAATISVSNRELVLTNPSSATKTITLSKALPDTGAASANDELRLYDLQPNPTTLAFEPAGGQINNTQFTVSPQSTTIVTLGANRNWNSGSASRENLYRIEFDHHYLWLPTSAERSDLTGATLGAADPGSVGLWIGEVIMDQVSSVTEPGRPLATTTSKAPHRLIIHVDGSGNAHLLSHVMFMQTKTADPEVLPEQVLVLNETKIPFYEGIEERAGKKVGVRIEAVSYDMPRIIDRSAQANLLANVATFAGTTEALVTDADISAYLAQLTNRDPQLVETYHLKWPLEGSLTASAVAQTGAAPLTMDPFHRSNPFRHAFHPQHGVGKDLSRSITLSFDATSSTDLLSGSYSETINGLAAFPLTTTGTLRLTRVSTTSTLVE